MSAQKHGKIELTENELKMAVGGTDARPEPPVCDDDPSTDDCPEVVVSSDRKLDPLPG